MGLLQSAQTYQAGANDLGYILAFHCAPAMEGIKPANLLSLQKDKFPDFAQVFHRYATMLHRKGVYFYKLAECQRRILLLVYNRKEMALHLENEAHRNFLTGYGYAVNAPLYQMFRRLRSRVERCRGGEYPHEIGVFLGYPLADVESFIRHRGEAFTLCGYWKVYHNPAQAKKLFHTYDRLRQYYVARLSQGETIHTIHSGRYS